MGVEAQSDLIADFEQALQKLRAVSSVSVQSETKLMTLRRLIVAMSMSQSSGY